MQRDNIDRFYKDLGDRIREHREQYSGVGLTQEQLAEKVGLSRASIVNVEKGRQRVAAHQLFIFAEALRVSPVDLLPTSDNAWLVEQLAESADKAIVEWAKKL